MCCVEVLFLKILLAACCPPNLGPFGSGCDTRSGGDSDISLHVGVSNPASCNASSHLLTAWKHGAGSRNAVNDHVCNNWVSILDHLYAVCPTRPERCDPGSHRLCQPKSSHRHKEIRNLRGFWCLWCPQDGPRLHRNVLKTGGIALARQRATRNSLQLTRTSRTETTMGDPRERRLLLVKLLLQLVCHVLW